MGVVFEAEHVSIRRRVAVKILHRSLVASAEMVERLRREAQVTSGLGHPNIVECLDFGSEDGQVYLVMEWLDGENLDQRIEREPLSLDAAFHIVAQTCAGLADAHEHGVVHRDVKPANLFLTTDRAGKLLIKILDFGIAKLAAEQAALTSTGVVIGTPNYMSPEQAVGDPVDARADIYAVGVILYELVAGRVPFQGETPLAVLHQHTSKLAAAPSSVAPTRGITKDIDAVVLRCLAKAPAERYQTMPELASALDALQSSGRTMPAGARSASRISREDNDEADHDLDVVRSGRKRMFALVPAGVGALALGVAGLFVFRHGEAVKTEPVPADAFVPSSVVDAVANDAVPLDFVQLEDADVVAPVSDATHMDATVETSFAVTRRASRFAIEARLLPEGALHEQPVTLAITISELDAVGRAALGDGKLAVRVNVEHFAKHDVEVRKTITLDADGRGGVTWTSRPGKHHVTLEPMTPEQGLGRVRFDIVLPR